MQEIQDLHRRYVDLSQRFRAGWVYLQFVENLAKLADGEPPNDTLPSRFQAVYGDLKECSGTLSEADAGALEPRLQAIGRRLDGLLAELLAEDSRVPPPSLRQFFQRFRSHDEKVLLQLARFYVYACGEDEWSGDRKDKVDFLVTRLADGVRGNGGSPDGADARPPTGPDARPPTGPDARRIREIFANLWSLAGAPPVNPEKVAGLRGAIDDVRTELRQVASLDDLSGSETLAHYREFKHSLDRLYFEPSILAAVVETNLAFRDAVRRLYSSEEPRIAADHQRIFDLEQAAAVDVELDEELRRFRTEVERFERLARTHDFRLDDLAELRERARDLIPRLSGPSSGAEAVDWTEAPESRELWSELVEAPRTAPRDDDGRPPLVPADAGPAAAGGKANARQGGRGAVPERLDPLVADAYGRLTEALRGSALGAPARSVVHTAELFPYRLEAREVVAFRRLDGHEEGEGWDEEAEGFVIEAAALRVALEEESAILRAALDETFAGEAEEAGRRGRRLAALAGSALRTFDHLQEQALLAGRTGDARALALLRVRLMRDYAELWLLAYQELRAVEE